MTTTNQTTDLGPRYAVADNGPGYLYDLVANHLTLRIAAGELPTHTALPAEGRLAREYGVSLGTARHATRLLRERGLAVTVKSKGTYVAVSAPAAAQDMVGDLRYAPPLERARAVQDIQALHGGAGR